MASVRRYGVFARTVFVLLFLVPFIAGLAGTGIHFIPAPDLRWKAFVVAVAYSATIAFLMVKVAKARPQDEPGRVPLSIKVTLGMLVSVYLNYVAFLITAPAFITQATGSPDEREYVIESFERGGTRARMCPYRLRLQEVSTVLTDQFCVSKTFARQHQNGETIRLTGQQSQLGFRFENVD